MVKGLRGGVESITSLPAAAYWVPHGSRCASTRVNCNQSGNGSAKRTLSGTPSPKASAAAVRHHPSCGCRDGLHSTLSYHSAARRSQCSGMELAHWGLMFREHC